MGERILKEILLLKRRLVPLRRVKGTARRGMSGKGMGSARIGAGKRVCLLGLGKIRFFAIIPPDTERDNCV